jgi:phospholipase/carboxylesterase
MRTHTPANTLRFGEPLATARQAVILVHGRGSSAEDIAGLSRLLPNDRTAFFAPSAENGTGYPERLFGPLERNEPWLSTSLGVIDSLVDEARAAGIESESIGIAGFSQGACLSLEYAFRNPRRYAFVAGLSGALIGPLDTPRKQVDLQATPVLVACAERDPHIPLDHVERTARLMAEFGASVTKQIFPGGAHTVFPEEIAWLKPQFTS